MAETKVSVATPPAENPVTPPVAVATPPQPSKEEPVTLSKTEHDKLQQQAAHAATAQKEAAGLQNKLDALTRRKVAPLPPLEAQAVATVKSQVASAIISSPKYAPLLQKNPTLAKVLAKNPLDILDRDEFIDEQDATNQVLDYLDGEIQALNDATVAQPAAVIPSAPAPKPINPDDVTPTENNPQQQLTKEQKEANAKLPPIRRITNTIASRLKFNE